MKLYLTVDNRNIEAIRQNGLPQGDYELAEEPFFANDLTEFILNGRKPIVPEWNEEWQFSVWPKLINFPAVIIELDIPEEQLQPIQLWLDEEFSKPFYSYRGSISPECIGKDLRRVTSFS